MAAWSPYAGDAVRRLLDVLDGYDEAGAQLVVDEVLDRLSLDDALTLVLCPPGERHDIAPLAFSILLRRAGDCRCPISGRGHLDDRPRARLRAHPARPRRRGGHPRDGSTGCRAGASTDRRPSPVAIAGAGASRDLADD